jgi:uncharacterized protein (TIGR00369 family)
MPHTNPHHLRDFPEVTRALKHVFEQMIPFNKTVGMMLDDADPESPSLRVTMQPHLVGNFSRGMLHGGVTAAVLDVAGGMMSMVSVLKRHLGAGESIEVQLARFARISTIDLRVDYLRPGLGESFHTRSVMLRAGSRVAVVRSDLFNETEELIASATAAYTVS